MNAAVTDAIFVAGSSQPQDILLKTSRHYCSANSKTTLIDSFLKTQSYPFILYILLYVLLFTKSLFKY